jgi:hypothetical protein
MQLVQENWRDHVVEPLRTVQGELFNTFRERQGIVTPEVSERSVGRESVRAWQQRKERGMGGGRVGAGARAGRLTGELVEASASPHLLHSLLPSSPFLHLFHLASAPPLPSARTGV